MIDELLLKSKQIIDFAISEYKPKAIVMMVSGGDDSITAYNVAKQLGIKIDFVIHGNTRTGIEQTTDFTIKAVEQMNDRLLIADAGNAYEKYVLRKGFFGLGETAHTFSYHVLKSEHFSKTVSKNLRKRKRNFPILFLNGARKSESKRRERIMQKPIRFGESTPNDIWVNIINDWHKEDCLNYLEGNSINRNPVSKLLCRSGECMCGTMQNYEARAEASHCFPEWGKWIDNLEKEVLKKFPWRWGENISKKHLMEKAGQQNMFPDFQPMCTGCKINYAR